MFFSIDASNGTPIYLQIVHQVKFAIAEGTLVAGQMVPSVRNLAKELTLNPNTIQRAYLELQTDKVLQSQRGLGQIVCDEALDHCTRQRTQLLESNVRSLVTEVLNSGGDPPTLIKMVQQAIDRHSPKSKENASS